MASRHIVQLLDDLDGGTADETVVFGLDGRSYEIDLSSKNAEKLREALASYESAGRPLSSRDTSARSRGRRTGAMAGASAGRSGDDSSVIRDWAAKNGHQVNSRGRIPAHVRQAYESR